MRVFAAINVCAALIAATAFGVGSTRLHAESLGAYVHGELRRADEKLITCLSGDQAVELAQGVNQVLSELRDTLIDAADDSAREIIYLDQLYPTPQWQALMDALYDEDCELAETADHTSRRTVLRGPEALDVLKASHSVVQSDVYFLDTQAASSVYIITTERVPPVE